MTGHEPPSQQGMFSVPTSFFEQPVTKAPRSKPSLTEFLLARITADEALVISADCRCHRWQTRPDCPDRILADCEAKRRIVGRITDDCPHPWVSEDGRHKRMMGGWCHQCDAFLCDLAAAYADHPDYRQEWKP